MQKNVKYRKLNLYQLFIFIIRPIFLWVSILFQYFKVLLKFVRVMVRVRAFVHSPQDFFYHVKRISGYLFDITVVSLKRESVEITFLIQLRIKCAANRASALYQLLFEYKLYYEYNIGIYKGIKNSSINLHGKHF